MKSWRSSLLLTTLIATTVTGGTWQEHKMEVYDPDIRSLGGLGFWEGLGQTCFDVDITYPERIEGIRGLGTPENPETILLFRTGNVIDKSEDGPNIYDATVWSREYEPIDGTVTLGEYEEYRAKGPENISETIVDRTTKVIPETEMPLKDNIAACIDSLGVVHITRDSRVEKVENPIVENNILTAGIEAQIISPEFEAKGRRL